MNLLYVNCLLILIILFLNNKNEKKVKGGDKHKPSKQNKDTPSKTTDKDEKTLSNWIFSTIIYVIIFIVISILVYLAYTYIYQGNAVETEPVEPVAAAVAVEPVADAAVDAVAVKPVADAAADAVAVKPVADAAADAAAPEIYSSAELPPNDASVPEIYSSAELPPDDAMVGGTIKKIKSQLKAMKRYKKY